MDGVEGLGACLRRGGSPAADGRESKLRREHSDRVQSAHHAEANTSSTGNETPRLVSPPAARRSHSQHLSANPKMEVVETLPIQDTTPRIKIVLQDDRVVEFEDTRGVSATEILDAFYTQASEIDAQWDEEGKSIDDMM